MGFFRSPGFSDVHSVVFCGLLNIGIAGCVLFVISIFGIRPWKTFHILPLWVVLSLVGIALPLFSDNLFTRRFTISIPLAMLLGICGLYANRFETKRVATPRIGYFVTASLMILWIGGYLMPSMQPAERLTGQLNRISNRARADIAISVRNFTMDESWGKRDEQPFASQLATLASLVKVSQDNRDFPVFASDYKISPVGETSFGFSLPAADWMTLALVSPGDPAVNNLFNGLPSELVAAQSRNFFGNDTTASLSHPEICQTCSLNLNESDSIQSPGALQDKMTSGSALQILNAFEMITDTTTPEGALASNALIANQDYAGLTRYLVRAPWLLHCGIQTETTREEVLIVDKGVRSKWGVVMLYNSQVPSRARVDSLPNRLFAEVGWRLYCYFDALPPLVPSGLQASGELPETAF